MRVPPPRPIAAIQLNTRAARRPRQLMTGSTECSASGLMPTPAGPPFGRPPGPRSCHWEWPPAHRACPAGTEHAALRLARVAASSSCVPCRHGARSRGGRQGLPAPAAGCASKHRCHPARMPLEMRHYYCAAHGAGARACARLWACACTKKTPMDAHTHAHLLGPAPLHTSAIWCTQARAPAPGSRPCTPARSGAHA